MTGDAAEWRPTAGLAALQRRAAMLASLRAFFAEREVLEVETPLLSAETTLDLHLEPLSSAVEASGIDGRRMYLQTSPELAMKRMLAAGSGSIYQVCKAFRGGERGRWHNPEFTILEWYRVGWDVHRLMREVTDLIETLLGGSRRLERATFLSYADLMRRHAGIDPYDASTGALRRAVADGPSPIDTSGLDRDDLLSRLFGERVEPEFAPDRVTVVFDYPASQAAMAQLNPSDPRTAERFEAYVGGYRTRQRLRRTLRSCRTAAAPRTRPGEPPRNRPAATACSVPVPGRAGVGTPALRGSSPRLRPAARSRTRSWEHRRSRCFPDGAGLTAKRCRPSGRRESKPPSAAAGQKTRAPSGVRRSLRRRGRGARLQGVRPRVGHRRRSLRDGHERSALRGPPGRPDRSGAASRRPARSRADSGC